MRIAAIIIVLLFEAAWPQAASSQLSHADSVLARALTTLIQPIDNGQVLLAGDSSLRPLLEAVPKAVGNSPAIFHIEKLTATIPRHTAATNLSVAMQGNLIRSGSSVALWRSLWGSFDLTLSPAELDAIESNHDPFVHALEETKQTFWSRTLEPALVVIGAAVIVALFFLVRG